MPALSTWNLDQTRLLTRRELAAVLADLAPRAARSANVHRNLVIVPLACCCGLRVSEIANLQLDDVVVDVTRPHLRLRRGTTKGGNSRRVPLWWDESTLGGQIWSPDPFSCRLRPLAPADSVDVQGSQTEGE
jgi:integrase